MPNFTAQVRTSYRDVAGLVLSCDRQDVVEDPLNPGFVREWVNRAPGLPSKPFVRQPGDPAPTYLGGRFSNPKNLDQATQPTLALTGPGEKRVQFDRARSTYLVTELIGADFPDAAPPQPIALAYQFVKGADASNLQGLIGDSSNVLRAFRRDGAGNAGIVSNGLLSLVGDHPDGTFLVTGTIGGGGSDWAQDGASLAPAGTNDVNQIVTGSFLVLGATAPGAVISNFLDGTLDSMHMWFGELSPKTKDLIWQTLNEDGVDYATDLRGPMSVPIWTDLTGDQALDEYDRLRPQTGFPHRYVKVSLPVTPALHRVQVACAVDGIVLPDSQLGGDLFTHRWVESPSFIPVLTQDAGWSAVFDFDLNVEGHYTLQITRTNGGGVILHFDVEVAP